MFGIWCFQYWWGFQFRWLIVCFIQFMSFEVVFVQSLVLLSCQCASEQRGWYINESKYKDWNISSEQSPFCLVFLSSQTVHFLNASNTCIPLPE